LAGSLKSPTLPERVLRMLHIMPGRTATQMAHLLNVSPAATSSTMFVLVKRGELRREKVGKAWRYYEPVKANGC
jgi:hypothetical protein